MLPDHIKKLELGLFAGLGLISIASVQTAFYLEAYYLIAIPFLFLITFLAIVDFKKIYYFLFFLIPVSVEFYFPNGLATDLPTEPLIAGLMLVTFLFILMRPGQFDFRFFKHPLFVLLLIHFLWMVVTAFNSEVPLVSFKYLLAKTWYISVFVILTGLLVRNVKDFKVVFWCVFISLTIMILVAIFRHSLQNFSFEDVNKPVMPFFRNHVNYAATITLFYPFLFVASKWYKSGTFKKRIINVGKVLYVLAIYLSFTRACMLALVAAAALFVVFQFRMIKPVLGIAIAFILFMSVYFVQQNNYLSYAPIYERTVQHDRFDEHLAATVAMEDASSMERFYRWIAASFMASEKPVFGYGPGNFYPFYKSYTVTSFETYLSDNDERSTVHNYFLLMLVEQGIVGFLIFISLTLGIFIYGERIYHRIKEPGNKRLAMGVLLSMAIIYINLLFSDLVETDKIGSFFFLNLALLINLDIGSRKLSEPAAEDGDIVNV